MFDASGSTSVFSSAMPGARREARWSAPGLLAAGDGRAPAQLRHSASAVRHAQLERFDPRLIRARQCNDGLWRDLSKPDGGGVQLRGDQREVGAFDARDTRFAHAVLPKQLFDVTSAIPNSET